jgi:phosphoribosylanthranilate isomerase
MLKVKVKVGSVTTLSDARYCAGMGVDMLGFPVGPGEHVVDPDTFKEITGWVSGPEFILEWTGDVELANFQETISRYNARLLQVNVSQLKNIGKPNHRIILRLEPSMWHEDRPVVMRMKDHIDFLEIPIPQNEGERERMEELKRDFPVLLHVEAGDPIDDLMTWPLDGISLSGSGESKPGLKDYSSLAHVLEILETNED